MTRRKAIPLLLGLGSCLLLTASTHRVGEETFEDEGPIICDLFALSQNERDRREEILKKLGAKKPTAVELRQGYAFTFPKRVESWPLLAELAEYESRCCPFLRTSLTITGRKDEIVVRIVGPEGVKACIEGGLKEFFPSP